jgi:hypothetical protein
LKNDRKSGLLTFAMYAPEKGQQKTLSATSWLNRPVRLSDMFNPASPFPEMTNHRHCMWNLVDGQQGWHLPWQGDPAEYKLNYRRSVGDGCWKRARRDPLAGGPFQLPMASTSPRARVSPQPRHNNVDGLQRSTTVCSESGESAECQNGRSRLWLVFQGVKPILP